MAHNNKKRAIPANPRNKGIMDKIRKLGVGQYIVATASTRNRFYTDFVKLGFKCTTRKQKDGSLRVYRSA